MAFNHAHVDMLTLYVTHSASHTVLVTLVPPAHGETAPTTLCWWLNQQQHSCRPDAAKQEVLVFSAVRLKAVLC